MIEAHLRPKQPAKGLFVIRLIILIILLGAIFIGWTHYLEKPIKTEATSLKKQLSGLQTQIGLTKNIRNTKETDLFRKTELVKSNTLLNKLKLVLEQNPGLKVLSLKPDNSINRKISFSQKVDRTSLVKNAFTLKAQGSYLDFLQFVNQISNQEHHIFWDTLDYQVKDYPLGEITLTFHSISEA